MTVFMEKSHKELSTFYSKWKNSNIISLIWNFREKLNKNLYNYEIQNNTKI